MNDSNTVQITNERTEQYVISYELLLLMQWMVDHEAETLKKIIARSLKNGLDEQLKKAQSYKDMHSSEDMQINMVEFLSLLEVLLYETSNEQMVNTVIEKNLIPIVDHIDAANYDSSVLKSTIAVASNKHQRNSKKNAQEIFLKELLKRWKPNKNSNCVN